jgi:hypothetical protein
LGQKLATLFAKYPNVDRLAMGFSAGWENELLWECSNVQKIFNKISGFCIVISKLVTTFAT